MKVIRPFFVLIAVVLLLFLLPKALTGHMRHGFISTLSASLNSQPSELDQLKVENQQLADQLGRLRSWLLNYVKKEREWSQLLQLKEQDDAFFARRANYLQKVIEHQLSALPARVVFREPVLWNSTLWVNVGQRDNRAMQKEIVSKNSPVLVGKVVVGVVEEVLENKSRIRLITDPLLTPSVRVVRGEGQNQSLVEHVTSLIQLLEMREDLIGAHEIVKLLSAFKTQLHNGGKTSYLAKGELRGSASSLGRVRSLTLQGVGFNYDFSDSEGASRELRTGFSSDGEGAEPLIKIGDLLVTTGMDGIFPADLPVAVVTKIYPLQEGGCSYQLEAAALLPPNINEVFIIPAL